MSRIGQGRVYRVFGDTEIYLIERLIKSSAKWQKRKILRRCGSALPRRTSSGPIHAPWLNMWRMLCCLLELKKNPYFYLIFFHFYHEGSWFSGMIYFWLERLSYFHWSLPQALGGGYDWCRFPVMPFRNSWYHHARPEVCPAFSIESVAGEAQHDPFEADHGGQVTDVPNPPG